MTEQFNPKTGRRGIEWCDETRNATGGCLHDCQWKMPDGTIAVCYAKELAESGVAKVAYPHGFEHHYWRGEAALRDLVKGDNPRMIFCDSMSDMFAANVPEDQVRRILQTMRKAPHHVFQSLTKAAPQLMKYVDDIPPNLWVGVSSPPDFFMGKQLLPPQQRSMLNRSMAILHQIREATGNIVWMSAEPVSWDLTKVLNDSHPLDWIVVGAASSGRKYFQPDASYVGSLLELMDRTNTPVFFKGNIGATIKSGKVPGGSTMNRWREDFPASYRDGKEIAAVSVRQSACRKHGWQLSRHYEPKMATAT